SFAARASCTADSSALCACGNATSVLRSMPRDGAVDTLRAAGSLGDAANPWPNQRLTATKLASAAADAVRAAWRRVRERGRSLLTTPRRPPCLTHKHHRLQLRALARHGTIARG